MKISITNHTGSRNRGCEALIKSTIIGLQKCLSKVDENIEFYIHSNDPAYDAWRFPSNKVVFSYALKTPNHSRYMKLNKFIYKVFGFVEGFVCNFLELPYRCDHISVIRESNLIVASGGDIFTSDYENLRKHMAPIVFSNVPVIMCSHSIGPFSSSDEKYFRKSIKNVKIITVREKRSYDYLVGLELDAKLVLVADVAFNLPAECGDKYWTNYYSQGEDVVALSISEGIVRYSGLDRDDYISIWVDFINFLIESGKSVLLIPHVVEVNPNNNDLIMIHDVMSHCGDKIVSSVKVASMEYSASELKGLIGKCKALVGTRTHATIASLSQCIPTVSVAYSRKAHGIMSDVFGSKKGRMLTINASDMSVENLIDAYRIALENPPEPKIISKMKKDAEKNFEMVEDIFQ